ncbi:hypothetical protein GCM10009849_28910 [Sinomonas flava]|uniref:Uncharacterized protein n=1 Tax=Sinomonas flava TaxID=496857 RepID=A0ABN3BYN1_9MICC
MRPAGIAREDAGDGRDADDLGRALGERACLVEEDGLDGAHAFEGQAVLDEDSALGGTLGRDGDDERDGEAERVGAGDHEDGDGGRDGGREVAEKGPRDEREEARAGREVEEERCGSVGERLGPGGGGLRVGDHALDARERRRLPHGLDAHPEARVGRDGARDDGVPGSARDGLGLARDHRLVELGGALLDAAVGGEPAAGAHEDEVTHRQLGGRDRLRLAGATDPLGLVGQECGERLERPARGAEGAHLEPVAQEHDRDEEGEFPPEVEVEPADPQARRPGRGEGNRDRHGDQQHHPRLAGPRLAEAALEERQAAIEEDHGPQDGADPLAAGEHRRHRAEEVPEHRAEVHDDKRQPEGQPETVAEHGDRVARVLPMGVDRVRVVVAGVELGGHVVPGVVVHGVVCHGQRRPPGVQMVRRWGRSAVTGRDRVHRWQHDQHTPRGYVSQPCCRAARGTA